MEKRGQLWFVVQFILFCAMLLTPFIGQFDVAGWLRALGLIIGIGGIMVTVLAYRTLGSSHSPWTNPIAGGHLVVDGIYHHLRHPIYAGYILGAFGWALLMHSFFGLGTALALLVFYDLKAREEEKWLIEKYSDYRAYQHQVKRFIPWIY